MNIYLLLGVVLVLLGIVLPVSVLVYRVGGALHVVGFWTVTIIIFLFCILLSWLFSRGLSV